MKSNAKLFASILIIYFVVDVVYQFAFGMNFSKGFYEAAGIADIFVDAPRYPVTILAFFMIITTVLLQLAVKPAIQQKNLGLAVTNALMIGLTSYGTLALCQTWSLKGFPIPVMFEIILEGLLFSPISAGLTTWWALRK